MVKMIINKKGVTDMAKMKAAIVGCGVISKEYLKSFNEVFSNVELCACSDLAEERMNAVAEEYGIRAMSYDDILADPTIEMVINLTTPAGHYSLTKKALEHGKHVYSEKMIAIEFDEAKELCEIARKNNVRLGCAPDTFLGGGLQTAKYVVDKGLIGKIQSAVVSLTKDFRVYGENLTHLFAHGGTIMYDMGPYFLTALCSLLGPAKQVFAFGYNTEDKHLVKRVDSVHFGKEIPLDDCNVVTAVIEFACGTHVTVHVNSSTIINESFILEFYGEKGIMRLGDPNTFGGKVILEKAQNAPTEMPFTHGYQESVRGLGAAEMIRAIEAGRPHRANMDMACHVLEIVHGVFTSIKTKQVYEMTTSMVSPEILPEGYIGKGFWALSEETALI